MFVVLEDRKNLNLTDLTPSTFASAVKFLYFLVCFAVILSSSRTISLTADNFFETNTSGAYYHSRSI